MDLAFMDEALARLRAVDPADRADPASIETLLRQQSEFGALVAQSVAAFDANGEWQVSGARSAASWLKSETRHPGRDTRVLLRRGRALRQLPRTEVAWLEGSITGAHVDVMVALRRPATEEALARDEKVLVDHARTLTYDQFVRAARYWELLADPDGSDEAAEDRRTRRDAYLTKGFSGTWFGKLTLDPVSGAIVGNELERLTQQLFEEEWAQARERLGREPTVADLPRSPGRRRADAFVLMAIRSATMPKGGQKPKPLFSALVGYETMHGALSELEDGTVVPPGSLLHYLWDADIERVQYRTDGTIRIGAKSKLQTMDCASFKRAVSLPITRVECPPTDRFFTGATRRAIEVRDRTCCHPHCDLPASWCQIDHIKPYSEGGLTTQENGRLLCGPHNRARNQNNGDQVPPPERE